jgi:hypothetical protein
VDDEVRAQVADGRAQLAARGDAQLVQPGIRRQPAGAPDRQVVDDGDLVAAGEEGVGQVGADEARPAGHEYPHGTSL